MKTILVATLLALAGLVPGIGAACDYGDEASASTAPSEQVASTPAPAATMAPAANVSKVTPNAVKPVASKTKSTAPAAKVATAPSN
jgi:hypothetical protein